MSKKSDKKKRKCRSLRSDKLRKCLKSRKCKRQYKIKRSKVLMYGHDGCKWRPVLVNHKGKIKIIQTPPDPSRMFHEEKFINISAQNEWIYLPVQETSTQKTYSYAVINRSPHASAVRIEVSPDHIHFAVDREETVLPGETKVLVPTRFLKYTRISVNSLAPDETVLVDIFYQAQSIA